MYKSKIFHVNRSKGFFIEHAKRTKPYYMKDKHYHSQLEIYYLLSGDRNFFIRDKVYSVQKGDLIIVNSNELHKSVDGISDSHERILIEFDTDFFQDFLVNCNDRTLLDAFCRDGNIFRLGDTDKKELEKCFYKIIQESKENNIVYNIALKVYFLELLIIINKFNAKNNNMEFYHASEQYKKIYDIISYININYKNDIGLESIAGKFFISSAHLSRVFKKVTGFSFVEYINSLRIKEAQKLLIETTLTVSQVYEKVGYQNSTHFGRVFKAYTGNSPREYRKLFQI